MVFRVEHLHVANGSLVLLLTLNMKESDMNRLTRSLAMVAGALVLAAASTFTYAQQVTKLKIQTAVPTASIYLDLMKRFGGVRFKLMW